MCAHIVTAGLVQMEKYKNFTIWQRNPARVQHVTQASKQAVGEHSKSPASSSLKSSEQANTQREK
jgi:hypothetical protein